ncbi:MAG: hypothetical protein ACRDG3_09095, partial [Tepidiformaceae bacterium]
MKRSSVAAREGATLTLGCLLVIAVCAACAARVGQAGSSTSVIPSVASDGVAAGTSPATAEPRPRLPALPEGWPTTLQLGMSDAPGGAAAMKATTNFGFRYQYLAGGVNTGSGWATWNTNGAVATYYIQDSIANNITPVFTYYQVRQSAPG